MSEPTEAVALAQIESAGRTLGAVGLCWTHYIAENHPGDMEDCAQCGEAWRELKKRP